MKVVALAGGVGGAKLVDGLARCLPAEYLTVVVNTGDDFEHLGLYLSPDLDTVCYTLAGLANPVTGWGRADETWYTLESLKQLGGPTWFRLGDRDLGTHLERTRLLREGWALSEVTRRFCQRWDVAPFVLPMSDDPIRTMVQSDEGILPFQEYFVRRRCEPRVEGFDFAGADHAAPTPGLLHSFEDADLVVICPSNPWVSVDPILAVPGIRSALESKLVVAVSPIVGGAAIKGPAAKMYRELGYQVSAVSVARHYGRLLRAFVIDRIDAGLAETIEKLGVEPYVTNTVMDEMDIRKRLAGDILALGERIVGA